MFRKLALSLLLLAPFSVAGDFDGFTKQDSERIYREFEQQPFLVGQKIGLEHGGFEHHGEPSKTPEPGPLAMVGIALGAAALMASRMRKR